EKRFRRGMAREMSECLEGCRVLFAHGLHLSDADCLALADIGWVLAYCPFSQLQFGFLGPFTSWHRAGGAWVLGTDCVACNDALDVQRELPLLGGEAALLAGFSKDSAKLLTHGSLGESAATE